MNTIVTYLLGFPFSKESDLKADSGAHTVTVSGISVVIIMEFFWRPTVHFSILNRKYYQSWKSWILRVLQSLHEACVVACCMLGKSVLA